MSEFATTALDGVVTAEGVETIDDRTVRALTECMTVLPMGGDVFEVVSESGSSYRVDARRDICDCPDYEYRDDIDRCKHVRRVAFAMGEQTVPSWVERDAVDPQIGEHTDGEGPRFANEQSPIADGGSRATETMADGEQSDDDCNECNELPDGCPCFDCYRDGATFEEGI
ncbi:hypothetical protein I7X12_04440 [Halosimplex litoreum]|uniref:SWIM-type domain-containing protein n=1 Tax=Halosimplex litoreum TaxID=1198301 RepID=A0A7T3KWG1_9EURY|nr:hypothetical protein [Halosimplex litoreum]QPV63885.1 hypothetical protein I7X12_04440 [Halosimplex litoreum]